MPVTWHNPYMCAFMHTCICMYIRTCHLPCPWQLFEQYCGHPHLPRLPTNTFLLLFCPMVINRVLPLIVLACLCSGRGLLVCTYLIVFHFQLHFPNVDRRRKRVFVQTACLWSHLCFNCVLCGYRGHTPLACLFGAHALLSPQPPPVVSFHFICARVSRS